MRRPTLFSHRKLEVPVASLAILVVPARTLRLPTAGIGTELVAHREKIEVTRSGSPFERSPVPTGRAHRPYTREFRASLRRIAGMPDSLAERSGFELSVPLVLARNRPIPAGFLSPRRNPLAISA